MRKVREEMRKKVQEIRIDVGDLPGPVGLGNLGTGVREAAEIHA